MQVLPAYRLYTGPAGETFDRLAAHPTYKAICNAIVWDGVVDRLNHSHRRAFVLGGKPREAERLGWPCVAYQVASQAPEVEQQDRGPLKVCCDFKDLTYVINCSRNMGLLSTQPTAFLLLGHTLGNQALPDEERPCLAFLSMLEKCLGLDDVLLVDVALASSDDPRNHLDSDAMVEIKKLEEEWYAAAGFPEVQRKRTDFSSGYRIDTYSDNTLILARVRYWLREWRDLCELAGFVVEQVVIGEAYGARSAGLLLRRAQPYEWHQACKLTEAQIKAQCKRGGWWLARRYLNLAGWLVRPCAPTGETYKYGDAL